MPVATSPCDDIPAWTRPAETKEVLDWAPLKEIDLSVFDDPGGKEKLAAELDDAVKNVGFWVVTGHGIPDDEVRRAMLDRCVATFTTLPFPDAVQI
ncbi:hypothetical protein C8F04DRAFT_1393879 [Mycena alexandri]|uniref:Non-haem dioxygenase N-terminal domain-containing protein n=1 Tax=Mycena alexandri TaxID=1745969 RepID=A0AAD6T0J6_9AGAR|nr:hypothetical protein C8F04DRAFT_1393879 [Mycena alexandri]